MTLNLDILRDYGSCCPWKVLALGTVHHVLEIDGKG